MNVEISFQKRARPLRNYDDESPANWKGHKAKHSLVLVAEEQDGGVLTNLIEICGKVAIADLPAGIVAVTATEMMGGIPAYKYAGEMQFFLSFNQHN